MVGLSVSAMERALGQDGCNAEEMSMANNANVPELLFDIKDSENRILELQKENDDLKAQNLSLSKTGAGEILPEQDAKDMRDRMVQTGNRGQG